MSPSPIHTMAPHCPPPHLTFDCVPFIAMPSSCPPPPTPQMKVCLPPLCLTPQIKTQLRHCTHPPSRYTQYINNFRHITNLLSPVKDTYNLDFIWQILLDTYESYLSRDNTEITKRVTAILLSLTIINIVCLPGVVRYSGWKITDRTKRTAGRPYFTVEEWQQMIFNSD